MNICNLIAATFDLAKTYGDGKRSVLPKRYFKENRDDKATAFKTKIFKLEKINRGKRLAIHRLVKDIGIIELSDSDIDDQQDRIAEVPLVAPRITVENSQQPVNDASAGTAVPGTSGSGQNNLLLVTDGLAGPLYKFVQDVSNFF